MQKNVGHFQISLGVLEYHGPHCAYGTDTLIPIGLLNQLENVVRAIMRLLLFGGPASYAARVDKGCSINVDYDAQSVVLGIFDLP